MSEKLAELLAAARGEESDYWQRGRRAQRRWRSSCCGSPKPWKHSENCPIIKKVHALSAVEEGTAAAVSKIDQPATSPGPAPPP